MFFDDSRPDRQKRANKLSGVERLRLLASSPIPPAKSYWLLDYNELYFGGDRTFIYDVESYINYFEVGFKCTATGKVIYFEQTPDGWFINGLTVDQAIWAQTLTFVLHRFLIVGFNSRTYDLPMCMVACQGAQAETLKQVSDDIILNEMQAYEVERKYNVRALRVNHIDLIEVAPIEASLKIYAGRLHCERMQDLPFEPHSYLTKEQAEIVRDYNINDLDNTELLFNFLQPHIELREQLGIEYKQDLRSKSDAQIAEAVIVSELELQGVTGRKPAAEPGHTFNYKVPDYIEFQTPEFKHALKLFAETPFVIGASGSALCPQELDWKRGGYSPTVGGVKYRFGVGGLHSSEKSITHRDDEDTLLIDKDVASFYPRIILLLRLFPPHLGEAFLKIYESIVTRRLKAKLDSQAAYKAGDAVQGAYWARVSEALKIVINGTFGKLSNLYSKLYAPELGLQTTVTGQLSLLMFCEMVHLAGFKILSVNTDGVVIKCPKVRYAELEAVTRAWEARTGFVTEEARYKVLASENVNNYIAIKYDQDKGGNWLKTTSVKLKGTYAEVGSAQNSPLSKNPEAYITSLAVQEFLAKDIPVEETVRNCGVNAKSKYYMTPISRFVCVRSVRGGAEKDGVYLGKAIRWYYAKGEKTAIRTAKAGNLVDSSQGGRPLMILPPGGGIPDDLDFDFYANAATELLYKVGHYRKPTIGSFFA